jgi:hypothetical protein
LPSKGTSKEAPAALDRIVKLDGYFAVPSIEHPVILREGRRTLDPPGLNLDISKVFENR